MKDGAILGPHGKRETKLGDQFLEELFSYCLSSFSFDGEFFYPPRKSFYKSLNILGFSPGKPDFGGVSFSVFAKVLASHLEPFCPKALWFGII